jgi:hypothetical protein
VSITHSECCACKLEDARIKRVNKGLKKVHLGEETVECFTATLSQFIAAPVNPCVSPPLKIYMEIQSSRIMSMSYGMG